MAGLPEETDRPEASPAPPFVLWMLLALASAIICQGWLTGLPAFVLTTLARADWQQGSREASSGKLRVAKVLTIAGILVGVCLAGYVIIAIALNATVPPPSY